MNNCIFEIKKVSIPQNIKTNFNIQNSSDWKYSIDIELNLYEEIDYLNLFLILKSYYYNSIIPVHTLYTRFKLKDKTIITQKENIYKIKNITFENFIEWINFRIKNDWEYDKKSEFYKITISLEKNIAFLQKNNNNNYKILQPIYPWKKEWLDFLKKYINQMEFLKKKIEILENENNALKKKK